MVTSADITNRALQQIAAEATVAGLVPNLTGGGASSGAANILYNSVVLLLLREQDWEFARTSIALTASGNVPLAPWQFEYLYPADCVKVRQVVPFDQSGFDPQPVPWSVADRINGPSPVKVIGCNVANAQLIYTTSNVTENEWDSMFTEAMVRTLGSELAMALGGRPDVSRVKLGEAGSILQGASGKDS